jgi:hypothetical protein
MGKEYKTSEILKESLKYLWNGTGNVYWKTEYVCVAIADTEFPHRTKVLQEIRKRLGSHDTITQWLKSRGVRVNRYSARAIQNYRKRWVLSMIAEFEAKGD